MAELSEIIEKDSIILIDGSIRSNIGEDDDIGWQIYDARNYSEIDREAIRSRVEGIRELEELLRLPNIWTIGSVADETKKLVKIIGNKINHLSKNKKRVGNKKLSHFHYSGEKAEEELKELQQEVYKLWEITKTKDIRWNKELGIEIKTDDPKYNLLLNMIKLVERETHLKRDSRYIYGKRDKDTSHDSDTDERMIATAYFLSLFTNKKPVLLTRDTDFVRILKTTPGIIGAGTFIPDNELFRQALAYNPIKLYLRHTEGYDLTLNSSDLRYDNHFMIRNVYPEKNEKLKEEMKSLWKQFN